MHLYIHVPFCARRCSYCDFAIAVRRIVPSAEFADLVLREWETWLREPVLDAVVISTVYFGGGTPSLLAPEMIDAILARVRADRPVAPDAEVTLEANPDDITLARARAWRAAGVNRVSLGVQSFDPGVLRWMHRTHGPEQAERAIGALREAGIGDVSVDLIFGLPAELGRDWAADLDRALALRPDHVSLYGLTVEPRTPLERWAARGQIVAADEARYADEYLTAHAALTAAGFEHYEVSNAARPGRRARHNGAYWRRAPYVGLGPSAHSAFGRERRWNIREWAAYAGAVGRGEPAEAGREVLDDEAVELERIYLGLRTVEGVPASRVPAELADRWIADGWAVRAGERLRLTAEGWLRLDALAASVPAIP